MNRLPFVSVVVETVTTLEHGATGPLTELLAPTLRGLSRQSYARDRFEVIVALDATTHPAAVAPLQERYPFIQIVLAAAANYFAHKNAGTSQAKGEIVMMLDGDCEPASDWLERLVARFEPEVSVVAGRTRYTGGSTVARTFSVPDFAYVAETAEGTASGFNVNNVGFRRDVLLAHPFDARVRRNGGCYFLFHQLRSGGKRIVYEHAAIVSHGIDIAGLGFLRKHFERGFDGVGVYRLDEGGVLRGSHLYRRFGALALIPLTARRIALDWVRLARDRRQIGISALAVPYFWTVTLTTRLTELAGGLVATFDPNRYGGRAVAP